MLGWFGQSWQPELPGDRRVYAIGDVHGRLDLLDDLLERIAHDNAARPPAYTEVIQLGDLVDRGPDSAGVVRRAMAPLGFATMTVLRGNHEAMMLAALDGNRDALQGWLRFGGRESLMSWGVSAELIEHGNPQAIVDAALAAIPDEQLAWLATRPLSIRLGDYYFVHAGVRPRVPAERQSDEDQLWIREPFLSSTARHFAMIVHGHSIRLEVERLPNRIGIDTGAYASGRLTALGLDGLHQWIIQTEGAG